MSTTEHPRPHWSDPRWVEYWAARFKPEPYPTTEPEIRAGAVWRAFDTKRKATIVAVTRLHVYYSLTDDLSIPNASWRPKAEFRRIYAPVK